MQTKYLWMQKKLEERAVEIARLAEEKKKRDRQQRLKYFNICHHFQVKIVNKLYFLLQLLQ